MTDNNKNLIPIGNGALPAIIERRTQIANRVLGQLSADQTEPFFRKYPEFFRLAVSRYYPLDEALIERFVGYLDWESLSGNEALPWNIDLIEYYKERWNWNRLSSNKALPWSIDFIERYKIGGIGLI